MTKNITKIDNSGLFDSIRHLDDDGNEYWLARELMPLLGYQLWQRFEGVIERATACLDNIGAVKTLHINHLSGMISGDGRFGDNYKLSRYACYLIAMNGDPRKPKIAAAQAYFVVKAREAELLQAVPAPQPNSVPERPNLLRLTKLELRSLWLAVALKTQYNQNVEDPNLLRGIDPLFWDMPLLAIEGAMNQLDFMREHHLFAARNQYYRAKLGEHKDLKPVLDEIFANLDNADYWRQEPERVKAMNAFSVQVERRLNRSKKKVQALTASNN